MIPRTIRVAWSILLPACITGFFASMAYFLYLSRHSPAIPNPSTGQVIGLSNHGGHFYVSLWSAVLAQSSLPFCFACVGAAVAIRRKYGNLPETVPSRVVDYLIPFAVAAAIAYMFWASR